MFRSTISLALLLSLLSAAPQQPRPSAQAGTKAAPTATNATRPRTGHAPAPTHAPTAAAAVPAPKEVLGFEPGEDRRLASWASVVEYFRRLDSASDRVRFEELGKTTLGAPFVMATISAPENLARLEEFKAVQRQLADPRTLGRDADRRAAELIRRGRAVVLITCGIHSTEVGSTLSSTLIAHRLASSDDPEIKKILRETVVLLVPSLNPDGVDIVKRWYDRTLGTPYEGTTPPELYHKYIGHDNNRDWYAFTQAETQLTVDKIHNVWRPQIVHDIHQQGAYGSRLFLPPYMRPVEPNVPRQLVEGYTELGVSVAKAMLNEGYQGITWNSSYDAWTPARAYSHYHGGVRILSETASARMASPLTVSFEQLRGGDRGYHPQKPSENFPVVWRGGEWRLSDITNYMTAAAFKLLGHAADNRERWLGRFYEVAGEAVRPRRTGELWGFVMPPAPNRGPVLRILERGGVEFYRAGTPAAGRPSYPAGTVVVPLAQPYGAFAKALLERQTYPDLRDADGRPLPPYDVTAHTLSLLAGVEAAPVSAPVRLRRRAAADAGAWRCCGLGAAHGPKNARPRTALYRSHAASMDEGWTRWVFEQHGLPYASVTDGDVRAGGLRAKYDAVVIPDQPARVLLEGHRKGAMPDEFAGGLGAEGVRALREFVEQGGTLVTLNEASDFAVEQLALPVRDVTAGLRQTEFYVPGSILRVELDTSHPLAAGMPRESIAWVEDSPAFEVAGEAEARGRVRVVARYPERADPLLSGWLLGGERLRGKAALVEARLGRGRVVLFGFRPQYRAQSLATYPLLFNALRAAAP
ncbi:MAG TPA: M14 family zinc carboxypeptidase [Pyrinomonadaceae bacterium]|nr:M14 family zinc carboxypeptidase [Pyrinomonadaceae bacterium]